MCVLRWVAKAQNHQTVDISLMIAILQCCLLPFTSLSKDNALIIHLSYRHYLPIYPIH